MFLRKSEPKATVPRRDILIDIPKGCIIVETGQRDKSDILRILRDYMEMDREMAFLKG